MGGNSVTKSLNFNNRGYKSNLNSGVEKFRD